MKKTFSLVVLFLSLTIGNSYPKNELYDKIDLFGEVLEKIKKDYVDEVDQSEMMDRLSMEFSNLLILTRHI